VIFEKWFRRKPPADPGAQARLSMNIFVSSCLVLIMREGRINPPQCNLLVETFARHRDQKSYEQIAYELCDWMAQIYKGYTTPDVLFAEVASGHILPKPHKISLLTHIILMDQLANKSDENRDEDLAMVAGIARSIGLEDDDIRLAFAEALDSVGVYQVMCVHSETSKLPLKILQETLSRITPLRQRESEPG